jgi:hypothetical protein
MAWPDRGWRESTEFDEWRAQALEVSGVSVAMKSRPAKECLIIASRVAAEGLVSCVCTDAELAELCGRAPTATAPGSKAVVTGRRSRALAELDSLARNAKAGRKAPVFAPTAATRTALAFEITVLLRALLRLPRSAAGVTAVAVAASEWDGALAWRRLARSAVSLAFTSLAAIKSPGFTSVTDAAILRCVGALHVLSGSKEVVRVGARVALDDAAGTVVQYQDGADTAVVLVDGSAQPAPVHVHGATPFPALPPPPEAAVMRMFGGDSDDDVAAAHTVVSSLASFVQREAHPILALLSRGGRSGGTSASGAGPSGPEARNRLAYPGAVLVAQALNMLWSLASSSVHCMQLISRDSDLHRVLQVCVGHTHTPIALLVWCAHTATPLDARPHTRAPPRPVSAGVCV